MGRPVVRIGIFVILAVVIAALFWWLRRAEPQFVASKSVATSTRQGQPTSLPSSAAAAAIEGESRLADELNAPGGTIQRDLRILAEVLETWQTNFPRTGNPVGENAEITASLTGDNSLKFAFIPRRHPAINARGELCDRWGTPFRFHQLSGTQMEMRSAGPDRKFGTPDDAVWTPAQ